MKIPQNFSRIYGLSLAVSGLLISGRHSGTEEITVATKRLMYGEKTEYIPPPDPLEISLRELEQWKARHPGFGTEIVYIRNSKKDPFDLPVQLKEHRTKRYKHPGMKKPPRLWQPNGQVPRREKQNGLEVGLKKTKSPYR